MSDEVRREVVRLGLDLRPIPVDVGDGIEWGFHPDPEPHQWSALVDALKVFSKFDEDDFGGEQFVESLNGLKNAMADLIIDPAQQEKWKTKTYGLRASQAIAEALMELWNRFPYRSAVALWEGVRGNWISLVTSWNAQGIRWREFSAVEILWLAHSTTLERLKEDKPQQVRMYLNGLKDYTALREWDLSQLKDSSDK